MRCILHICCKIQLGLAGLRYAKSEPGQIQRNCSFAYSVLNIQIKETMRVIIHIYWQMQLSFAVLRYVNSEYSHIEHNRGFADSV